MEFTPSHDRNAGSLTVSKPHTKIIEPPEKDPRSMPEKKTRFGEFELDFGRFQLCRNGKPVRLEGLPLQLLMFLAENPGQLITREQIADRLWGNHVFVDVEQGINTAIRKIRRALDDDSVQPQLLQTVVGRGYRFVGSAGEESQSASGAEAVAFSAEELGRAIRAAAGLHEDEKKPRRS